MNPLKSDFFKDLTMISRRSSLLLHLAAWIVLAFPQGATFAVEQGNTARAVVEKGDVPADVLPNGAPHVDPFTPPAGLKNGWYAYIDTSMGRIVIRLLPHQSPQAVAHFAGYADGTLPWFDPVTGEEFSIPYYDGTTIQKAFARQRFEAAERNLEGRIGPIRYIPEEGGGPVNFIQAYKVGATRASGNRISAVQFFITAASQPFLSPRHPCFAEVVIGHDVVDRITEVKTYSNDRPIEPVVIDRIRTFKVGEPDPLPAPEIHVPRPSVMQRKD